MAYWIEFESRWHLVGRQIRYSTNIEALPELILSRTKRNLLSVLSCGRSVAKADLNTVMIGGKVLKRKTNWGRFMGMVSKDLNLDFEWHVDDKPDSTSVRITADNEPREQYVVTRKIASFIQTKTCVRIESAAVPRDLELMVGCLAYLWNYFEFDRTYD